MLAEIDGKPVLFTNMRLDRDTVPEGLFCYDVRDSDDLDGSFAEIKRSVWSTTGEPSCAGGRFRWMNMAVIIQMTGDLSTGI